MLFPTFFFICAARVKGELLPTSPSVDLAEILTHSACCCMSATIVRAALADTLEAKLRVHTRTHIHTKVEAKRELPA